MNSSALLIQLTLSLPATIVGLGAIVYAVFRWKRHPKVSALAVAAFLFQIVGSVLGMLSQSWVFAQAESGAQPADIATIAATFAGAQLVCGLFFLILIVLAVFVDRAPKTAHPASERSA